METETAVKVLKTRMWIETGHTWDEIDSMSLERFGDVVGYWTEKNRANKRTKK